MQRPVIEKPDLDEKGAPIDGQPQRSSRRLYMQLLAFTASRDSAALAAALAKADLPHVLYEDVSDPQGVAVLTWSDDPGFFIDRLRPILSTEPFSALTSRPEFTMIGRTYSLGYEPDLNETLFDRPIRTATNDQWPWAVWYPIRREGEFEQLDEQTQRSILMEHGTIGRSWAEGDYAHDIRLACHGLDKLDNDFLVGLMGKELFPLSAIVQRMRKTKQTSVYLERLGPFFVGRMVASRR